MATWSLALQEQIQHKESFKPQNWGVPGCQNTIVHYFPPCPIKRQKLHLMIEDTETRIATGAPPAKKEFRIS